MGPREEAAPEIWGSLQGDAFRSHLPTSHSSCFSSSLARLPPSAVAFLSGFILSFKTNEQKSERGQDFFLFLFFLPEVVLSKEKNN